MRLRSFFFIACFALALAADAFKFALLGGRTIVDWPSLIHPAWVLATLSLFALGAWINQPWLWRSLFWFQFIVFAASYTNQYVPWTTILTYNCMLFNLIFTALYFFIMDDEARREIGGIR